jgi:hypothetical protein
LHNHYFTAATQTLTLGAGDRLFAYAYIDPANPPAEIMLQWSTGGEWRNVYWGADNINWVGTRYYVGPVPAAGRWVRLEVSAALLNLEGTTLHGMSFNAWGGRVTWDRAGRYSPPPAERVWVEDSVPAGGVAGGNGEGWLWANTNPGTLSGSLSHQSNSVAGFHNHYFYSATETITVAPGDKLFCYVYLEPGNRPTELMLQWYDGTAWRNAYWGEDNINWIGARTRMGDVPTDGEWVRLEVPASTLGLGGKTLSGMAFNAFGGRVTWDRAGLSP